MAEPINMQFGMPSRVGPGNIFYVQCRCPMENGTFGGVWPIGFGRLGKMVSYAKKGGPISTIYMPYDVILHKELPLGCRDNCTCIKIFSSINFSNPD